MKNIVIRNYWIGHLKNYLIKIFKIDFFYYSKPVGGGFTRYLIFFIYKFLNIINLFLFRGSSILRPLIIRRDSRLWRCSAPRCTCCPHCICRIRYLPQYNLQNGYYICIFQQFPCINSSKMLLSPCMDIPLNSFLM